MTQAERRHQHPACLPVKEMPCNTAATLLYGDRRGHQPSQKRNARADWLGDVADSRGWIKRIGKLDPPKKRLTPEISTGPLL